MDKLTFKAYFKPGLGQPIEIKAVDEPEAKKLALAYYRKNTGFVETVDFKPIDAVVDRIEVQPA